MSKGLTFPIIPRRRISGAGFGEFPSARWGRGHELVNIRPYRPGDPIKHIDWKMTARRSAVAGIFQPYVKEFRRDEVLHVVIVVDRSPRMSWYQKPWRLLSKPEAIVAAGRMIVDSAMSYRSFVGYLDYADWEREKEPFWRSPNQETEAIRVRDRNLPHAHFTAQEDNLSRALEWLMACGAQVPPDTMVFILSDFLGSLDKKIFEEASVRFDIVPVVIQDPTVEASFPVWKGRIKRWIPILSPEGKHGTALLSGNDSKNRRRAHQERLQSLCEYFRAMGVEPVTILTVDEFKIFEAFSEWSVMRSERRY